MAALIVAVLIVPLGIMCTGIFLIASAFGRRRPSKRDPGVPPAQVASGGRNPLRVSGSPRRHPVEGVLCVIGGTMLLTAGVSAYRALYELTQWFR